MKVRCNFIPLVYNNGNYTKLEKYANFNTVTHARLDLYSLKQELFTKHDYTELIWEEYELIKSSQIFAYIKENRKIDLIFQNICWTYDCFSQVIYINNIDINL